MKQRPFWISRIESLWKERSVLWLSGVRRIGKTVLSRQLADVEYFNCDLPSIQRQLSDPEFFFSRFASPARLVLDEVHRLSDPSQILKIAADEYAHLHILATGSSTLEATRKFRDSLTGRKMSLGLPPVLWRESALFGVDDLDRRCLNGGFPEILVAETPKASFFEEWIDSFYARDVQELFGVRNRTGFLDLVRLLFLRSGGQLDITDLSKEAGISRPTVMAHIESLAIAHVINKVPPFHGGGHREIIKRPKMYGFDTGMVAHIRGWERIRETDRGHLWEHLVLDELRTTVSSRAIHYWRDKSGREIDFVVDRGLGVVDAIEAKITPDSFNASNLIVFRSLYPNGDNYLICPYVRQPYSIRQGEHTITVCGIEYLNEDLSS